MSEQEYTGSGDPIHRYENQTPKHAIPAFGDEANIEAISAHIEKYIGPPEKKLARFPLVLFFCSPG